MFIPVSEVRQRGIAAENEGRYVAAVILLEQCLRGDCSDSYGWLVLADAYRELGRYTDCARALDSALELAPQTERWVVYIRYAMLATKQGLFARAEQCFEQAAEWEESQSFRWPLILRAANLMQMELFDRAEELLRYAIAIEDDADDLDEVFLNIGLALIGQGKYEAAAEILARASETNPESKPIQLALKCLDGVSDAVDLAQQIRLRT